MSGLGLGRHTETKESRKKENETSTRRGWDFAMLRYLTEQLLRQVGPTGLESLSEAKGKCAGGGRLQKGMRGRSGTPPGNGDSLRTAQGGRAKKQNPYEKQIRITGKQGVLSSNAKGRMKGECRPLEGLREVKVEVNF